MEVSEPPAATPHSWKGLPMSNATTFVGLDVHARPVKACAFVPETGETIRKSFGYEPGEIALSTGELTEQLVDTREPGPGYGLIAADDEPTQTSLGM